MLRHPAKLAALILLLAVSGAAIYYTAQMRMKTPPRITVVREEWLPRGNIPNAYLRIHYEMKNTTMFPVLVHWVNIQGPDSMFGGDFDSEKDALLLKPGQVRKRSINITIPDGEPFMNAAFLVSWEPGAARRLGPLVYKLDLFRRKLLKRYPPDPFAPPGSPDAPLLLGERSDLLESMRFERPKSTTP
ncbi:hypothetical protein [Roseimicrobium gellanilyticum]|nr:hypothetical protein [Roseimicrobium gellanilyticum]